MIGTTILAVAGGVVIGAALASWIVAGLYGARLEQANEQASNLDKVAKAYRARTQRIIALATPNMAHIGKRMVAIASGEA